MGRKKPSCPSCGGELLLGQAHKCPMQQKAAVDWRWAAGIILAILLQIVAAAYGYGKLAGKVNDVDKRLDRIENLYFRNPNQ